MSKQVLSLQQVTQLIDHVDEHVQSEGCDHTTRFASCWAEKNHVPWQDLQDALDQTSLFCDCEIVLNLDEERPLVLNQDKLVAPSENRWLLPPNFQPTITKVEKILVGRAGIGKNNHVSTGEWLIPAPVDAVPRRRIRKLVHFFIGLNTGLPTEIAFVESIEPMSLDELAGRISDSTVQESQALPLQVAAFIAQKIAQLPVGTCVGTDIIDKVGIASKHRELSIYRVIVKG
jgi:hypothetical protein